MLISVIIPVKNRADLIIDTIKSVVNTGYSKLEIIVVDNNSNDGLENVIKKFSNIKYLRNHIDKERSYSRNLGILNSNGEYITFLDSDDLLNKDIFNKFLLCSKIYKQNNFFFSNYDFFDKKKIIKNRGKFIKKKCLPENMLFNNQISNIGFFIHKNLAKKIMYDENRNIIGSEDYDFVLRAILKSKECILIDKSALGFVRLHEGRSVFNDEKLSILKRYYYFIKKITHHRDYSVLTRKQKNIIQSNLCLYTSLLLMNLSKKLISINFLLRAFKFKPTSILSRRFIYLVYRILN